MSEQELRQIPLTALFITAAVLFPQFFHLFGLGATFLPMFLPVFAGAMILSWKFTLVLGVSSPLISWLFTGMPPLIPPVLPVMIAELGSAALLISVLRYHRKKPVWLALGIGILWDRLLLFFLVTVVAPLFGITHPLFSIALVASGIPGIVLQLVIIPQFIPLLLKRFPEYEP